MFTATDLACSRGERTLFSGLRFTLRGGDWLHVKGENGAGKTTLLRSLVGLSPTDHGEVHWRGADIRKTADAYRRALLYLGHPAALKDELSALENLRLALELDGFAIDDGAIETALQRVGLGACHDLPARHLSAGQRRRVVLARLLLRPADLWVLDEPFNGLDSAAVGWLGSLLGHHLERGGIAVVTSHQPVPVGAGQEIVL